MKITETVRATNGLLDLAFDRGQGGTQMRVQAQRPPLKVVRGFGQPDGSQTVHLLNVSGGVLGGDHLKVCADLGSNAQVQMTTTGATRVYRQRPELGPACLENRFTVGPGGLLEYLPDTLIPYQDACLHQNTHIYLADSAGLFYWEVLAPGRVAHKELFAYQELCLSLRIDGEDGPILRERMRLQPAQRPVASALRLGSFLYFGVLYICRVGVPVEKWLSLEEALNVEAQQRSRQGEIEWAASALAAHGLTVRGLGQTSRALSAGLTGFWQLAKQELYGAEAVPPRKVY